MPATIAGSHLGPDTHANRPAANAAGQPVGALYSCTTHGLIYKTDGSAWSTYATLGSGTLSDQGVITYLDGTVAAAPGTPAAGKLRIYAKTGPALAVKNDAGVETVLGQGIADQGAFTFLDATEAAAPATPASGKVRVYAKADGRIYSKDDAGVEYGPFDAAGGAGGPLLYIDDLALHAKGDEFSDPDLGQWTLGGGLTTADTTAVTTEPYDATCVDIVFGAQSDYMYQAVPTPASGNYEIYLTWHGVTNSTPSSIAALGGMIAPYFSDNSGNGTGMSCYDDGNAYMWGIASNAYSATGNTIGNAVTPPPGYAAANCPIVYKLSKSGSTITGGVSFDGGLRWKTHTRTDSTTFTRMGIIRLFTNGGTNPTLRVGRFNVVEL